MVNGILSTMKAVAIIGASNDRKKYGNKAVRAYLKRGWSVYPVNPHEETVEGIPCYKNVLEITDYLDRVSVYLPPKVGMQVIGEIAQKKPAELFLNPGAESDELVATSKNIGLNPIMACSIIDIGEQPINFN